VRVKIIRWFVFLALVLVQGYETGVDTSFRLLSMLAGLKKSAPMIISQPFLLSNGVVMPQRYNMPYGRQKPLGYFF